MSFQKTLFSNSWSVFFKSVVITQYIFLLECKKRNEDYRYYQWHSLESDVRRQFVKKFVFQCDVCVTCLGAGSNHKLYSNYAFSAAE